MLTGLAVAGTLAIVLLLVWRWIDRMPEAPRFEVFSPDACCSHCETIADCYRPHVLEVRPAVASLAWIVPVGLVASRFRIVNATWERPSLCRLHYSLARSALDSALASEALELARYLEGRASRLVTFQSAVLVRMLRRSTRQEAKELAS